MRIAKIGPDLRLPFLLSCASNFAFDLIFGIVRPYHPRALEQAIDRLYLQDLGPNHCLVAHNFLQQMFGE